MDSDNGLIYAGLLDGKGGAGSCDWAAVRAWRPESGCLWVHLDRGDERARNWLIDDCGLEPIVCEAMLAEETRPRWVMFDQGLLVILRGVNLNPGANPEDMVSIRMWIEKHRVISVRLRRLMAMQDVRESLSKKRGPHDCGDLLVQVTGRLIERMEPVVRDLEDELDGLEEKALEGLSSDLRHLLGGIRRRAITLRRFIGPQRDVLLRLQSEDLPMLENRDRIRLREVSDRITRHLEDLDALRERASVINDELATRLSEQMNKTMYSLALVATVFLPLGLLTGLLGINVGGIPGAENPLAFAEVCAILVFIAMGIIWFFRQRRLM